MKEYIITKKKIFFFFKLHIYIYIYLYEISLINKNEFFNFSLFYF
jgi:hypothetical protein